MKTYKVGNWEAKVSDKKSIFWNLFYFGSKKATYSTVNDCILFEKDPLRINSLEDLNKIVHLLQKDFYILSELQKSSPEINPKQYIPNTEDAIVELGQRVQSLELELSKLKQL